jgi:hypothetical protein
MCRPKSWPEWRKGGWRRGAVAFPALWVWWCGSGRCDDVAVWRSPSAEGVVHDSLGEALGTGSPSGHALKVRLNPTLIPDIPFIECHTVALEKQPKFLFECHRSVMLFLLLYVRDNGSDVRLAHREGSIAPLPTKSADPMCFQPFRGGRLQVLHDDRNRLGLCQLAEDMHMIRNASHNQCWALEIFQNRS